MLSMAKRAEYLGPERRRPLVLDAALAIFAEGGFADASMSAVAARAGVSKAVLYDCFPGGKQEIYYALLDRGEADFMTHMFEVLEVTNKLPLEGALRAGLAAFLNWAEIHPLGFKIIFGEAGTADAEIAKRTARAKDRIIEKMGERTQEFLAQAGIPMSPIIEVYNRSIVAVAEELARWVERNPTLPREHLVEAIVRWFMDGFATILPESATRGHDD
jgi:AcrR family transcriptional regulator